jgi:hypothetical protein
MHCAQAQYPRTAQQTQQDRFSLILPMMGKK